MDKLIARIDPRVRENTEGFYEAASLTKTLFAYCVIALSREDGFDLDRPLHEYAPEYALSSDPRAALITAKHALTHSTGMKNWEKCGDKTICFTPGASFQYSGEGYYYLQKCIESATGLTFQALLDRFVNGPLGTHIASRFQNMPEGARFIERCTGEGEYESNDNENSAFSAYTNASDYAAFLHELFSGKYARDMMSASVEVNPRIRWYMGFGLIDGRYAFQYGDNGDYQGLYCVDTENAGVWLRLTNTRYGLMQAVSELDDEGVREAMTEFLTKEYGTDYALLFENASN